MKKYLSFIFVLLIVLSYPIIVKAESTADRIHFIKNEEGSSDAIIVESNGHCGVIDTMNPSKDSSTSLVKNDSYGLNFNTDNGKKVKKYIQSIGCNYVDFLIMTHNHTDHFGGVGDIRDLINDKTIVFHKQDKKANPDVEEDKNWFNNDFYNYSMNVVNNKNAVTCDVSAKNTDPNGRCYLPSIKTDYITKVEETPDPFNAYDTNVDYTYYFTFGDYKINLYNLYNLSWHAENYNSIITLVTHTNGKKALLTGDIETSRGDVDFNNYNSGTISDHKILNPTNEKDDDGNIKDCAECDKLGIENQIADVIGKVDVLKAAHHGLKSSNSYYAISKYQPKYYIIDNIHETSGSNIYPKTAATAAVMYMKKNYSTETYYTSQATNSAVAVVFNNNGLSVKDMVCSNNTCTESNMTTGPMGSYIPTKIYGMNNLTNDQSKLKYVSVKNNQLVTNEWIKVDSDDYYIGNEGVTVSGLQHIPYNGEYGYYYFDNSSSKMQTGWIKTGGIWYYFRTVKDEISTGYKGSALIGLYTIDDNMYYFNNEAKMQKGFVQIDNDTYYFRKTKDEISTGPEGSALVSKCLVEQGTRYCFDAEGKLKSTTPDGDSSNDKIHFINNEHHAGDATVIESNGHFGLIDTMKPPTGDVGDEYDNGTKVANYLKLLGVDHLDFLIITHSHSDHIGGVEKIKKYITSDTIVFYKPDSITAPNNFDLEDYFGYGHIALYNTAKGIFDSKNTHQCAVTAEDNGLPTSTCYLNNLHNSFITGVTKNTNPFTGYATNLDDNYSFEFGNYTLNVYNTHHIAHHMENLNSTPVLITHKFTGKKIAVLGDIQAHTSEYEGWKDARYITTYINKHLEAKGKAVWTDDNGKFIEGIEDNSLYKKTINSSIQQPFGTCTECTTLGEENQIADIIGPVDVVKAAHHGYDTSNSAYSIFKYEPEYIIYAKNKDKMYTYLSEGSSTKSGWLHSSAIALLSYENFGTKNISTYQSTKAIVLTFNDSTNAIKMKNMNASGEVVSKTYTNIATKIIKSGSYKDTNTWYWIHNTNSTDDAWIYMDSNGKLTKGWLEYKDNWYYLSKKTGIMLKGIHRLKYNSQTDTYYLTPKKTSSYPEGAMQNCGWKKVDGKWYYFRKSKDDYSTGPKGAAVTGWYKNGSEWFYLDDVGVLQTGIQKVAYNGVEGWYYFGGTSTSDPKVGVMLKGLYNDGKNIYYLRNSKNEYGTGDAGTMVFGLNKISNKTYYFRTKENEYGTGPIGSAVKDSCIIMDDYKYCFNANGEMTSKTEAKSAEIPTNSMCNNLTYTGSEQTLTKDALTGYTWSNNKQTNAGNYQVTAKLSDGYTWVDNTTTDKTITCSISKIDSIAPTVTSYNDIYDGNPHTIEVTAEGTVAYSIDGLVWIENKPTRTDVGKTTIYVKVVGDNNHNDSEVVTGTITITEAPLTKVEIPTNSMCNNLTYTGSEQTLTKDALTGYTWSNNKQTNAGSYQVPATLSDGYIWNDNSSNDKKITCAIAKATYEPPTVISYNANYDGKPHSIQALGDGTLAYSIDGLVWIKNKPTRTDAGTTTVYVKVAGDDNHNDSQVVTGTITIVDNEDYTIITYDVDDTYISNIKIDTDIETFKDHIILGTGYTVEIDTKTINNKKVLYTGGKTKILKNGNLYKQFTNIVKGDTNGTGQINSGDLLRIRQHLLGTKTLQDEYFKASDVNDDQVINSGDLLRVRQHLLGTRYID